MRALDALPSSLLKMFVEDLEAMVQSGLEGMLNVSEPNELNYRRGRVAALYDLLGLARSALSERMEEEG